MTERPHFSEIWRGSVHIAVALCIVMVAVISPDGITNKLVWSVDISGTPKNNVVQGGRVFIDAHSGEILKVNPFA